MPTPKQPAMPWWYRAIAPAPLPPLTPWFDCETQPPVRDGEYMIRRKADRSELQLARVRGGRWPDYLRASSFDWRGLTSPMQDCPTTPQPQPPDRAALRKLLYEFYDLQQVPDNKATPEQRERVKQLMRIFVAALAVTA